MPTRRRFAAAQRRAPVRRKRSWAREIHSQILTSGTPVIQDMLADWKTRVGVNTMVPGATLGGFKGSLDFIGSTASGAGLLDKTLRVGLLVANENIEAVDVDWAADTTARHQDWLYLNQQFWNQAAASPGFTNRFDINTRVMRKIEEVGETLWLFMVATATTGDVSMAIQLSSLIILP